MQEYEYVITDSVGLTDEELDGFRRSGPRSNASWVVAHNGARELQDIVDGAPESTLLRRGTGLIGATIQVETKDGEVVGRFAYYVRREP